jgi:signal transduction histidine kinase
MALVTHEVNELTADDESSLPNEKTAQWSERLRVATNTFDPILRESDDIKRLLAHDTVGNLETFYRVLPILNKPNRSDTMTLGNIQTLARNALWTVFNAVESLEYWTNKPLKTEPAYPDDLVRQGEGFLRRVAKSRSDEISLGIIIPDLRAVSMHRGTIGTLLANMVSNALQHGEATDVTILGYQGQHHADIVVMDNGKGIEKSVAERIFEYGFSGEGRSSGLGLAEADKRLEAMGGRLFLMPHGGLQGGAEFVMRLPEAYARQTKC